MARPRKCRRVCMEPDHVCFRPEGASRAEKVILTVDEYEVIRLIDLGKMTHEQCGKQMDISRTTVTEIYESAREKIADCIVNGKILQIFGGDYRLYGMIPEKGEHSMRVAVTYENGNVFQHFGHTEQFKVYDVEDGRITAGQVTETHGSGHGALAGFLKDLRADVLICGGIGMGAKMALEEAGIRLYGGVSGDADEAVRALLEGKLNYNPDVQCSHHGEGHHGEGHHCGEHSHGCGGHGSCGQI